MISVIIHIQNEDPIMGEMDDIPSPGDQLFLVKNPRRKDGKDINYIDPGVATVIWPISRLNFIEILPNDENEDKIISFVRES
jgi:hypothetical protein